VRVIAKRTLKAFWEQAPGQQDVRQALEAWHREARRADWRTPHDVKAQYRSASIVGNNRIVFNICGNKYRLVAQVNYAFQTVLIRFVGTHADYDSIDVENI